MTLSDHWRTSPRSCIDSLPQDDRRRDTLATWHRPCWNRDTSPCWEDATNWETITSKDITCEEFIRHCNEWNNKYGENINKQLKFLGSPLDWEKYFYTLDDARSKSVKDVFINLFNKGKIYRAERLINWDCALQTAISDN